MTAAAAPASAGGVHLVIEPTTGWKGLRLGELWAFRDLFWLLAWRDVKVRYRQTILGVGWAVLQPLITVLVFGLVFGRLAKVPSNGLPYALYAYAALLPWTLFAGSVTRAANSLVSNASLLSKTYFPRLLLPIGSLVINLVDFAISLVVFAGLMAWYGVAPRPMAALLPLFLIYAVVASLAVGIWLSALNVRYRDVQFALPFLVQIGLFISPVVYPASLVPASFRILYDLNPMTLVIQGFRWGLLGDTAPSGSMFTSIPVVIALLVLGLFYFRRTERYFADII